MSYRKGKVSKMGIDVAMEPRVEGTSRISSKGQVTVPVEIRNALNAKEGDQLRFFIEDHVVFVEVVKHMSADQLFGLFNEPEDEGDFVLDLEQARENRANDILNKDRK